jgi:predicted PurR-regulated permease PerM
VQPVSTQTTKRTSVWITLGVLTALTAWVAVRIAGPYLEALLAGAALATLFHPLHLRLRKHIARPGLAATLATVLVIITVVVPLGFAVAALVRQLRQGPVELLPMLQQFSSRLGMTPAEAQARLEEALAPLLRGSLTAATAAGGGILQFIVAMAAFHFSLLHGEQLREQLMLHSPLGRQRTETLLETVHHTITASFYGVVAVAAAQGVLLGLGAWIAGLPAPALWGAAAMLVSVLPVVGSALVWIPGAILLLSQGKITMGLFFLAWSAGLVANADNVVRPLIVMASLPVNGLLVFISLLGGVQAFGLIGIFVGPVTLAVGIALLRMLREEAATG